MSSITENIHEAVKEHGEVHMVVSEYDDEIEARLGQTTFDHDGGVIHISGPDYTLHINDDEVVSYYEPVALYH